MIEKYRIFIPNRGRDNQIKKLLPILNSKFDKTDYKIKIIEQNDNKQFNLAKLTNIGFDIFRKEEKDLSWNYIFQPADCYPIKADYNLYKYDIVCHLILHYCKISPKLFCYNPIAFIKMNGYSNDYWGWGAEDCELKNRIAEFKLEYDLRTSDFCLEKDVPEKDVPDDLEISQINNNTNIINLSKVSSRSRKHFLSQGLNTLEYELANTCNIDDNVFWYKVNL